MIEPTGTVFVVAAPSGTGKTSLVAALLKAEPTVELSISYTTRLPREGETQGKHYYFVDKADFEAMIVAGDFAEYAEVYGHYYGTRASWLHSRLAEDRDVLLEIDWQGARQVRKLFPTAVTIFIMPPSIEELERRLRGRATDSEETIVQRLAQARSEVDKISEYDFVVVNDDFQSACMDLVSIIHAWRLRSRAQCIRHANRLSYMGTSKEF